MKPKMHDAVIGFAMFLDSEKFCKERRQIVQKMKSYIKHPSEKGWFYQQLQDNRLQNLYVPWSKHGTVYSVWSFIRQWESLQWVYKSVLMD